MRIDGPANADWVCALAEGISEPNVKSSAVMQHSNAAIDIARFFVE